MACDAFSPCTAGPVLPTLYRRPCTAAVGGVRGGLGVADLDMHWASPVWGGGGGTAAMSQPGSLVAMASKMNNYNTFAASNVFVGITAVSIQIGFSEGHSCS